MKIINKLGRVFLEILTGAVTVLIIMGIVFGLAYFIGMLGDKIVYILLGIGAIAFFGKVGKDTLETIEYYRKSKAELKEFIEKYKE